MSTGDIQETRFIPCARCGGEARIIGFVTEPQARSARESRIRRRLMVLEEALQSIEGNITPDLTVFSTMARVAGGRLGEGRWPAHATPRWDY